MTWKTYQVVLRLRSPLHIGQGRVGNVQRTRPYVTGRALWGALTERLTRDNALGPATDSSLYEQMGWLVHGTLAFTYLYPTTREDGELDLWPWDDGFRARFLSTYASTALTYPEHSADDGSLHEVEYVAPYDLESGRPVYLSGYVFEADGAPKWQLALERLQIGAERGYGWGRVLPEKGRVRPWLAADGSLFGLFPLRADAWPPVISMAKGMRLPAHAPADGATTGRAADRLEGTIEPLVGRVTDPETGESGTRLSQARVCYAPGALAMADASFRVGAFGLWEDVTQDLRDAP